MLGFSTGLTALRASQTALDTIAHNIANANDPNYHRQVTDLASRQGIEQHRLFIGGGVDVAAIRRLRDETVARALSGNITEANGNSVRLDTSRQIETILTPSTGSLNNRLDEFLNELERLTASPQDATARRTLIQRAESLAKEFNSTSQQLNGLDRQIEVEISALVGRVNQLADNVAALNRKISVIELQGQAPNDLLDSRDRQLNELAELLDTRLVQQAGGPSVVIVGDHGLIGQDFTPLEVIRQGDQIALRQIGENMTLSVGGGKLGGLLASRNELAAGFRERIDQLAHQLIAAVNEAHATGVGIGGSFHQLAATTAVNDPSATLNTVDLPFELQAGSVFVSVLDETTGERTLDVVTIDPDSQSLSDVAAAFSAVDHLQAVVDDDSGKLTLLAEPGFAFDFTGSVATRPSLVAIAGTAEVTFQGRFDGLTNQTLDFSVPTTGTIGVTPGLVVEVRNAAGQLLTTLDVGDGYQPGTPLEVFDGVEVSFSSGDFVAGDSFSTTLVGQPDSTGLLVALGLNSLLVGQDAASIGLNSRIKANPDLLATTKSGQAGDTSNLEALISVRDQLRFGESRTTVSAEMQDIIASVGFEVEHYAFNETQLTVAREQLDAQRNALSGVDPNEELVQMLQFQRAFQVASRFISAVDQTLAELIAIVR